MNGSGNNMDKRFGAMLERQRREEFKIADRARAAIEHILSHPSFDLNATVEETRLLTGGGEQHGDAKEALEAAVKRFSFPTDKPLRELYAIVKEHREKFAPPENEPE